MNWLGERRKDFGDVFEDQVERMTKIRARLVFTGKVAAAREAKVAFALPEDDDDKEVFIIERKMRDKTDHHAFILVSDGLGQTALNWWVRRDGFDHPIYFSQIQTEKSANELTRILARHWDFIEHVGS